MFTSEIRTYHCTEGDTVKLTCSVYTDNIEVKWFKKNTELHHSTQMSITSQENFHMLTIKETTVTDAGPYCVKAKNVEMEIPLKVKGN